MRSLPPFRLALAVAAFAGIAAPAHAQYATLSLQSQPGDYIGLGQDYNLVYTPASTAGGFFFAQVDNPLVGGLPAEVTFDFQQTLLLNSTDDGNFVALSFGTNQLGLPLQSGTYTDAQRAAFAATGHPGLDVEFQSRGSNTVTGSFTITNAVFTPDAAATNGFAVEQFDATFVQHSEGDTPALLGTFSYRANGSPPAVPEPSSLALLGLGLLPIGFVARNRRRAA